MFLKSTLLALAAVAALGTTALTTSAEAKGFHKGGHGFHGGFHGKHFGHGHFHRHRHVHWRHRYYVRPVVYAAAPAAIYAARPVVNRCTCLTKEYTPEGAVLFKDLCTNEAAINPPPAPLQTGMAAPQTGPQQ